MLHCSPFYTKHDFHFFESRIPARKRQAIRPFSHFPHRKPCTTIMSQSKTHAIRGGVNTPAPRKKTRRSTAREGEQEELREDREVSNIRISGELLNLCFFAIYCCSNATPSIMDIHFMSVKLGNGRQAEDIHKKSVEHSVLSF